MNKDYQLMDIDEQEKFIKNYQAVYYAMNAKPDCKSKLFPEKVTVNLSDLYELNRRVVDKFKAHYEDAGFSINIAVSLQDLTVVEFNSWLTFENYNFSVNSAIKGITIVWEYNAKLPKYPLPQKHTLTVRLADELRPQDVINLMVSGKLSEMDLVDQEFCPVVARVDFINSLLGDELLMIVNKWVEGLVIQEDTDKFIKLLRKNKRKTAYIINYITSFMCILCCLFYFRKYILDLQFNVLGEMTAESFYGLLLMIVTLLLIYYVVHKVFFIIATVVFRKLDESGDENHIFVITKGDKKICDKLDKRRRKNYTKISLNLIFTLLFNIFCSILATILVNSFS